MLTAAAGSLISIAIALQPAASPQPPARPRCEYLTDPLGIDAARPRLSWEPRDNRRGAVQSAYQILVASSPDRLTHDQADLWDSGQVRSNQTAQVEYAGKPLPSAAAAYWKVRTFDREGQPSPWSQPATWTMGLHSPEDWKAQWIGMPWAAPAAEKDKPPPRPPIAMVRTTAKLDHAPTRALLFITARGLYEFHINGHKVGDHELAPEWTDYTKRIEYQTYDVTPLLHASDNALGAFIADGWFAGRVGFLGGQIWGAQTSLLAQLQLDFPDGSRRLIITGPDWKSTLDGPIRHADLLDGETYDARNEMPGWDSPGFDDHAWTAVNVFDAPRSALVPQPNEPIRITAEIKPVSISEPAPGIYVADFGQNLPGHVRLRARGTSGSEITIGHAEMLDEHGRVYTTNLRGAAATDRLILSGRDDTLEPRFTYHGFRYAEITGLASRPADGDLIAQVVHSDAPDTGSFECSNPMLNKLMSNIKWTQRANMMSVPTDCPQRDERLGWMGDAQIFAQTAAFNMDTAAFFAKWSRDIRDAQGPDGRYSDFSPNPLLAKNQFTSVPGWGDAGVTVPWCVYQNNADTRLIAEQFESARRWIDYIRAANTDLIWRHARGNDYGDWLNGDTLKLEGFPSKGGEVPKEIFATACWYRSCRIVADLAAALGKTDQADAYRDLATRIRAAFITAFVNEAGVMPGETQAGYALALHEGLCPDPLRPAMAARLLSAIDRYQGHLSTGFHSTVPMMDELVASGHADAAYHLLTSTDFPGWGFMIEHGATSLWERWDGYVPGRANGGFQDPGMNSFNHFAFGAIGEWMYETIGGINPDPTAPGWSHFIVKPVPGGGLTWAKAHYHSIRGEIATSWKIESGKFELDMTVPPNTTATVYLPTTDASLVNESGVPVLTSEGVTVGGISGSALVVDLRAGKYGFEMPAPIPSGDSRPHP